MAFPATITLTVNAVAKVLDRVNDGNYASEYLLVNATEQYKLLIRHTVEPKDSNGLVFKRHNVFLEHIVFPTATTLIKKRTVTVTLRNDQYDEPSNVSDIAKALNVWMAASTNTLDLAKGSN